MIAEPQQKQVGAVRLSNVRYLYPGKAAVSVLDGLSIDVLPGEFVSVLGPSGCGKSTILSLIAGFIKPTGGTVEIDGRRITKPGPDRSVVFQQFSLFPWKTVVKNVEFSFRMRGIKGNFVNSAARELLAVCGLEASEKKYPHQLSGGMKQRVGIVRALAAKPAVLLMDEPFGALDAQTRANMQQVLLNVWDGLRVTVVFITHDIEEALFLSDRVIVMASSPGRIVEEISVSFERPRPASLTTTREFADLKRRAGALIHTHSHTKAETGTEPAIRGQDVAAIVTINNR